jgi:hypothetical protein
VGGSGRAAGCVRKKGGSECWEISSFVSYQDIRYYEYWFVYLKI